MSSFIGRCAVIAGVGCGLLFMPGCSGGGQNYTLPDRVCGVAVDGKRLAPLLPDGGDVTARASDISSERPRCRITVDNQLVVNISRDVVDTATDPFEVSEWRVGMDGDPAPAAGPLGQDARIADSAALVVKACTYRGSPHKYAVLVELTGKKPVPEDRAERRKALERFVDDYVPSALTAQGCS
ncbi:MULTISPECIES: hypothetical protein [unclassified Streptomyces]|uniref:hypothetical protein n=1 Tax=unclassified Streptomyces TaxID=2593676 RepID=UPI0001C1AC6B|nr:MULTISPECIES: hypothetical protein [unclassified Streptomyces]MYS00098.1 hypothetical protein [Streptomyces sp. SID4940]MYT65452.1 hypothetical protein [Streptomyces sp. SID8357]SCE12807.1 hypothetical protein GA0115239_12244 [Streptomyces sp. BpilaLS-43]SCL85050.1 hypothetical protein SAMN04883147_101716 [Streptomyces sp. DpondAA-F4]AEN10301.1 hypothetical protein SACTE_2413 [Streptomyces sp. SirexAA-E]